MSWSLKGVKGLRANENSKEEQINCLKYQKKMSNYDLIGFSFASDWLREWREFSGPMRMK